MHEFDLWLSPRRQCNGSGSPHGVYTHCRCRRSGPGSGCAAPPACTWNSTWTSSVSWTPGACPWPKSGRHRGHPSSHRPSMGPGQWWEAASWRWGPQWGGWRKRPWSKSRAHQIYGIDNIMTIKTTATHNCLLKEKHKVLHVILRYVQGNMLKVSYHSLFIFLFLTLVEQPCTI